MNERLEQIEEKTQNKTVSQLIDELAKDIDFSSNLAIFDSIYGILYKFNTEIEGIKQCLKGKIDRVDIQAPTKWGDYLRMGEIKDE